MSFFFFWGGVEDKNYPYCLGVYKGYPTLGNTQMALGFTRALVELWDPKSKKLQQGKYGSGAWSQTPPHPPTKKRGLGFRV